MSFIECCVCFENDKRYTQVKSDSKCQHPVCVNCFKEMIDKECFKGRKKIPCPLCTVDIESPEIELASAIDHIENVSYERIYDPEIHICDEMIFLEDEIIFVTYEDIEIEKTSKKSEMKKFNYMNKIIPKNRNKNITKMNRIRY